jgi:hypothetical protein
VKDEKVTIDNWMKVLEWFGPLESLDSFLDRIVNLLAKPCVSPTKKSYWRL